ncbi:hypothetical protein TrLO_g232 [Triparma laevis f. longispina]|nr:hypothetical protein TrLO_g232 [Triparma laevis f. longispina]
MASFASAPGSGTIRTGDGTVTVNPSAPYSGLVILMHGLGDSAEGFADVAEMWARSAPHIKFILPTAPTQPVTLNGGFPMPSWYDIIGLSERSNENCEGIEQSRDTVIKIMEEENKQGLAYDRMMLSGFSQGGAMSLFTGLQLPAEKKIAGVLAMSGYLAGAKQFSLSDAGKTTPVLHCHGTVDPMVQFPMAKKTESTLKEAGIENYELKAYEIQHTVIPEELAYALDFIKRCLPPDESCAVKEKEIDEMSVKELKAAIRKGGLGSQAVGLVEKSELRNLLKENKK